MGDLVIVNMSHGKVDNYDHREKYESSNSLKGG